VVALSAIAASMVLAAPSGAAGPSKEFLASFKTSCVVDPGVLNLTQSWSDVFRYTGPSSVSPAESGINFTKAHMTMITPEENTTNFISLGVTKVRATLDTLTIGAVNLEPAEREITGLVYEAPLEAGRKLTIMFPREGTFSFGPYTVTGKAGEIAQITLNGPAFTEPEPGAFKSTGRGIQVTLEGFKENGELVAGPASVACNPPEGMMVVSKIPIVAPVEKAEYKNWKLAGSITDPRLGQPITLPEGATFNGAGEVNTETGAGSVKGSFSIPSFTSSLSLFGPVAVNLGMTLTEAGSFEGAVAKSEATPGDETLSGPVKLNASITSLGILGLTIPTSCATKEPITLNLGDTLTKEELLTKGWSFAGTTTIPRVRCAGGFLGQAFGFILSRLLSEAENPFALTVSAPTA
jgi:hypothetical protein